MSRLDAAVRRLTAQRDCINFAAILVRDRPGPVLEFGLGNGRTYDHLREVFPDREVYVFDREVYSHPDSTPDPAYVIQGDFQDTLPGALERIGERAALAHCDFASANQEKTCRTGAFVAAALDGLVQRGGVVLCSTALSMDGWTELPLRPPAPPERYYLYRIG